MKTLSTILVCLAMTMMLGLSCFMTYELQQSKQRYEDITAKQQELVRKAFKILTEKQEEHEDEF